MESILSLFQNSPDGGISWRSAFTPMPTPDPWDPSTEEFWAQVRANQAVQFPTTGAERHPSPAAATPPMPRPVDMMTESGLPLPVQPSSLEAQEQPADIMSRAPVPGTILSEVRGAEGRLAFGARARDFLVQRGLQPHQAAALAGNFIQESAGNIGAVNPGDGRASEAPHSGGISQWNGRRLAGLVAYARETGIAIPEGNLRDANYVRQVVRNIPLETQLGFVWRELETTERGTLAALRRAPDVTSATAAAIGFFRPQGWTPQTPMNGHGFSGRLGYARRLGGPL